MKKVYQTKFGGKDAPDEEKGNCWQACVASILEIPLEDAMHDIHYDGPAWLERFNAWLRQYGLACIEFKVSPEWEWGRVTGTHIQLRKSTTGRATWAVTTGFR